MFVRQLRGLVPSNIILILLFSILLWLKLFFAEFHQVQLITFPYFASFFPKGYMPSTMSQVLAFSVIIFEAIYIIRLNVKYIFLDQRTFFHSFVFIAWITTSVGGYYFYSAIIANLFLIIAYDNILKLKQGTLNVKVIFNSGLLVSLASIFYPPSIFLIIVFWIFALLIHGLNWRGLFAQILGFLSVWMVLWLIFFVNQSNISIWNNFNFLPIHRNHILNSFHLGNVFYIDILLLTFSVLFYFGNMITKKIIVRKYFNGFFWTLMMFLLIQFVLPFLGVEVLILISVPATFFISNGILTSRSKLLSEIMFLIILLVAIYNVILY